MGVPNRVHKVHYIEQLIGDGKWHEARRHSAELIEACLEGLRYLETCVRTCISCTRYVLMFLDVSYDRLLIRGIVIVAYLGWAAYTSISLLPLAAPLSATAKRGIDTTTIVTLLTFCMVFWMQKSPWTFYIYVAFPCYFWREFCMRGVFAFRQSVRGSSLTYSKVFGQSILVVLALQSMVVCCIFAVALACSQSHTCRWPTDIDRYGVLASL